MLVIYLVGDHVRARLTQPFVRVVAERLLSSKGWFFCTEGRYLITIEVFVSLPVHVMGVLQVYSLCSCTLRNGWRIGCLSRAHFRGKRYVVSLEVSTEQQSK